MYQLTIKRLINPVFKSLTNLNFLNLDNACTTRLEDVT